MELGISSHPGPGVYAYYLRSCYAKLFDIGTSYPIRPMTVATTSQSVTHLQVHRRYLCHVMTRDKSSSWNSSSSLHTPTALDKAYDDHVCDIIASRTDPRYSHCVHVTCQDSSSLRTNISTTLNDLSNWSRLSSLWPLLYGTSCCFIEFASGSRFYFPILSEPETQVTPTNPPRLPYDDSHESVQST
ncbi:UNVERIFIED_CONTAM: NAD(P)H-quinone oxidoreductase subunit K, chloroplastic [Sesamum latifolium]|uniref:NAD(P)H-quinone oxidoreductase subunit K, chloroplastic n=1 Tax=Sesamum latifolium TaxID=2727402 RepID=A0AAW2TC16_9LAMI